MSTADSRRFQQGQEHITAADRLVRERRHKKAFVQYAKAADLLESTPFLQLRRYAISRAGLCAAKLGRESIARELLQRALKLAVDAPLPHDAVVAHLHLHDFERGRSAPDVSHGHLISAAKRVDDVGDAELAANVHGRLGAALCAAGHYADARTSLLKSRHAADGCRSKIAAGEAENALGDLARAEGDVATAEVHYNSATVSFGEARHMAGLAASQSRLGNLARTRGALDLAVGHFETAKTMAIQAGDVGAVASAMMDLGNVHAARGDLAAAEASYTRAEREYADLRHPLGAAGARTNRASIAAQRGSLADALAMYDASLEVFEAGGQGRHAVDVASLAAQLCGRLGRLDEAQHRLQLARDAAASINYAEALARLDVNDAAVRFAKGDVVASAEAFVAGAERFCELDRPADEVAAQLAAADAWIIAERFDAARAAVARSRQLVDSGLTREKLDVESVGAKLAFVSGGGSLDAVRAMADTFEEAGRSVDALGVRAFVLDREPDADAARIYLRQVDRATAPALAWDLESISLVASAASPDLMRPLLDASRDAGLALLTLTLQRRHAQLLALAGRDTEAAELRANARAYAESLGAAAHVTRLQ